MGAQETGRGLIHFSRDWSQPDSFFDVDDVQLYMLLPSSSANPSICLSYVFIFCMSIDYRRAAVFFFHGTGVCHYLIVLFV
jgi:hypothetical protein